MILSTSSTWLSNQLLEAVPHDANLLNGCFSMIFIDDIYVASSRINSELQRAILSASSQRNPSNIIRSNFILQQDNYSKTPAGTAKNFTRSKRQGNHQTGTQLCTHLPAKEESKQQWKKQNYI